MTDAGAGAGAGARLLSSLRAAGCPSLGRLRGEDLDWMFEGDPEVAEWLRRLCAEVGAGAQDAREVTLDREEVEEWEALRGTERVLEGRALEEALQTMASSKPSSKRDGPAKESLSSLRSRLAQLEEELEARETASSASVSAAATLSARQTAAGMELARRTKVAEGPAARDLKARQEEVMHESGRWDEALEQSTKELEAVFAKLRSEDFNMVHKASTVNLAHEDEEFLKTVEALTKKQFSQAEDHGWLSQPSGEDRLLQCAEAQRLIDALKVATKERLAASIALSCSGEEEKAFDRAAKQLLQDRSELDVESLRSRLSRLDSRASALQRDLSALSSPTLEARASAEAEAALSRLRAAELQVELQRALHAEGRLKGILDMLLAQRARQTFWATLEVQEQDRIRGLSERLTDFCSRCESWRSSLDEELSSVSRLSAFAAEKNRPDAVAKSDAFVNALVDLLHGKGYRGPSRRIPPSEVLSAVESVVRSRDGAEEERREARAELDKLLKKTEEGLSALHSRTRARTTSATATEASSSSSSSAVSSASGDLQRAVRAFELSVLDLSSRWEKERRSAAASPEEAARRRIWVDFFANPKVMEANVDAMAKKAAIAAEAKK